MSCVDSLIEVKEKIIDYSQNGRRQKVYCSCILPNSIPISSELLQPMPVSLVFLFPPVCCRKLATDCLSPLYHQVHSYTNDFSNHGYLVGKSWLFCGHWWHSHVAWDPNTDTLPIPLHHLYHQSTLPSDASSPGCRAHSSLLLQIQSTGASAAPKDEDELSDAP